MEKEILEKISKQLQMMKLKRYRKIRTFKDQEFIEKLIEEKETNNETWSDFSIRLKEEIDNLNKKIIDTSNFEEEEINSIYKKINTFKKKLYWIGK